MSPVRPEDRLIERRSLRIGVLASALMAVAGIAVHVISGLLCAALGRSLFRCDGRLRIGGRKNQPQCGEASRSCLSLRL